MPQAYVDALLRELARLRWQLRVRRTLYFGGGTPSLLRPAQLAQLIDAAQPRAGAEITLEANPETLTPALLRGFFAAGANRLSLGVQTAWMKACAAWGARTPPPRPARRCFGHKRRALPTCRAT